MFEKAKIINFGMYLVMLLLVTSCRGTNKEPTPDISAVQTEAVMQVLAQLTVDAALNPTDTPIPATMASLPTAIPVNITPSPTIKHNSSGGDTSSSGSSGTAIPTWTPDAWKCEIVDEYPLDVPQIAGWEYDRHWIIKNIGTTTWWANDVYVEYDETCTSCQNITYQTKFYIKENVEPGDTIDIFVDMDVPTSPVEFPGYTMAWNMISENGGLICEFWNNIPSTYPAPTKTPAK